MSVHTLSVSGLRCAHCVQVLGRNLRRVPGVRKVEIRPSREEVEVDVDPRFVQPSALEAAVRESGLHVQKDRRPLFELEVPPELDVDGPEEGGPGSHGHEEGGHDHGGHDHAPEGLDLGGFDLGELDFGEPDRGNG